MKEQMSIFISFKPDNEHYRVFFPFNDLIENKIDVKTIVPIASNIYEHYIASMRVKIKEIDAIRKNKLLVPARIIWELGDLIFHLTYELKQMSLEIDGLYEHLIRDLNLKRKRLEKIIIFRRYISNKEIIPDSLNWGRCEKGTRRIAEKIQKGTQP